MSEMSREDALAHFGVKGMRWGVRRENDNSPSRQAKPRGAIRRGLTKAGVGLEAGRAAIDKGEAKLIFLPHEYRQKAASATQIQMLGAARGLNKSEKYRGKDIKRDAALRKDYHDDLAKVATNLYAKNLAQVRTEATLDFVNSYTSSNQDRITMTSDRIRHAESDQEVLAIFKLVKNSMGLVTDIELEVPEDGTVLKHYDEGELMDELDSLVHFGIKGMRWGVRNDGKTPSTRSSSRATSAEIKTARKNVRGTVTKWKDAKKEYKKATTAEGARAASKAMTKYDKTLAKSDDLRVAHKTTKGESALLIAMGAGVGTLLVGSVVTSKGVWNSNYATSSRAGNIAKAASKRESKIEKKFG